MKSMNLLVRVAMGVLAALTLAFATAQPALAGPLDVLSATDARFYASAFDSARRGDFEAADADLVLVQDRSLVGYVLLIKLMHPTSYTAGYGELTDWLGEFGDLAGADRVYALAVKRRPEGTPLPPMPGYLAIVQGYGDPTVASAPRQTRTPLTAGAIATRQAYYSGDIKKALALAPANGQRWIAGLASYRLGRFADARGYFEAVARDPSEDDWIRAGGAFWAARAATQDDDLAGAEGLLRLAATWPNTFYGMIAARGVALHSPAVAQAATSGFQPAAFTPANDEAARSLVNADPRAWRAAALMQIARPEEAGLELRAGLTAARSETERKAWAALSSVLSGQGGTLAGQSLLTPAVSRRSRPISEEFPTPDLFPAGGFTLDRALVYAITRQESGFNPFAVSHAGAMGLMQVLPNAAAHAAGDDQIMADPFPLLDGPTNLRIGQDHFSWLMEKLVGYDLLSAIASYNCGPAPVMKLQKSLGTDDSLMLMESLPAGETREYVARVAVAYWTYRRLFGSESPTLDALANGWTAVDLRMDQKPAS
jgi:soluble lytic murein transglycosylase-like protein